MALSHIEAMSRGRITIKLSYSDGEGPAAHVTYRGCHPGCQIVVALSMLTAAIDRVEGRGEKAPAPLTRARRELLNFFEMVAVLPDAEGAGPLAQVAEPLQ